MSSTTHHETTIEAVADLPLIRIVREFDAPRESVFVVESDGRFAPELLPGEAEQWDIRDYPPARIAIRRCAD